MIPEATTRAEAKDWVMNHLWVIWCKREHTEIVKFDWMRGRMKPISHCLFCMDTYYRMRTAEDNRNEASARTRQAA